MGFTALFGLYFYHPPHHTPSMSETQTPPLVFDNALLRTRRSRASRRSKSFLMERAAQDAAERMCDINRQFENALIIGAPDFVETLLTNLPSSKRPLNHTTCYDTIELTQAQTIAADDNLPFDPGTFDLIISGLSLHTVNDLPGALIQARRVLRPDGLFIGAMLGGETLMELRQACYAADDKTFGGLTPRIFPFADYSQTAALLQRSGFALPVVDADRFTVRYKAFETLVSDIRDMGDMNCLVARQKTGFKRAFKQALVEAYTEHFSDDGKFKATFEILWLTGWSPHESQQKPLKPGSAKMRLADALNTTENKLK